MSNEIIIFLIKHIVFQLKMRHTNTLKRLSEEIFY